MKRLLFFPFLLCSCQPVILPEVPEQETVFVGYKTDSAYSQSELYTGVILEDDVEAESEQGVFLELPAEEAPGKQLGITIVSDIVSFDTSVPSETLSSELTLRLVAAEQVVEAQYFFLKSTDSDPEILGVSEAAGEGFPFTLQLDAPGAFYYGVHAFDSSGRVLATAFKGVVYRTAEEPPSLQSVSFLGFHGGEVANPVVLSVGTHGPVHSVRYLCDGLVEEDTQWTLGESFDGGAGYGVGYHFLDTGQRTIHAQALDSDGRVVAEDVITLLIKAESNGADFVQSAHCESGQSLDCTGNCVDARHLGDGYCDDGEVYSFDFNCEEFGLDAGDCAPAPGAIEVAEEEQSVQDNVSEAGCPAGTMEDCNGICANVSWVGDGTCDDASKYTVDLNCEAFDFDGGDCSLDTGEWGGGEQKAPIPYFYQKENDLYPTTSGPITALAMMLGAYGWNGVPDDLLAVYGNDISNIEEFAKVFNQEADAANLGVVVAAHGEGEIASIQAHLEQNTPVFVLGRFSEDPHGVLLTGFEQGRYIVNDPMGEWSQEFMGGYPFGWNADAGESIEYEQDSLDLAISSNNGYNVAPIRYLAVTD